MLLWQILLCRLLFSKQVGIGSKSANCRNGKLLYFRENPKGKQRCVSGGKGDFTQRMFSSLLQGANKCMS